MTKKAERQVRSRARTIRRASCLLVLVALLLGFFWSEQNWIEPELVQVQAAPTAFAGLRIAVLSDIHGKEFGEDNTRLLKAVEKLKPDIITVTGDLVHDPAQFEMIAPLAEGLAAIAPTYYVTGNHEWATREVPRIKEILENCGVIVLSNEYRVFEEDGQKLALLGADDLNGRADQKTVAQLAEEVRTQEGAETYLLLLSHRNNRYESYAAARIDLTLCGHAHGGQIRLPFTDGVIGPQRELFPDYTAGLYDLSYGTLFVSRGLSDQAPAFRLFNRPHLPLVILEGA